MYLDDLIFMHGSNVPCDLMGFENLGNNVTNFSMLVVTFLVICKIVRECNAGLSEAVSFLFTNSLDMLASFNTLEVFQFSVLEGGL